MKTKGQMIDDKMDLLRVELDILQDQCKHKRATKEYRANTGNHAPSDDHYWTEFTCPTCLKKWNVEGSV